MAKTCSIQKEKKRALLSAKYYEKRQELKKIVRSLNVTEEERHAAIDKLNSLPKNSSPTRKRNRCQLTGRSRGYLSKFKLSRLCFREMASAGLIPGVFKASW